MRDHELTCTFCRKSENQVRKLVSGPGVYICDACVEAAYDIVQAEGGSPRPESRWRRAVARVRTVLSAGQRRLRVRSVPVGHA